MTAETARSRDGTGRAGSRARTGRADGAGPAAPSGTVPRVAAGETEEDAAVLASLDFEPVPEGSAGSTPEMLPALAGLRDLLLPDASEDPEVALAVGGLVRERLAARKSHRLSILVSELVEPTGPSGSVLVREGEEGEWLGALNDLRLLLAHRLGIETPEDAEAIHEVPFEEAPVDEPIEDAVRRGLALTFTMVTWWQESLVTVLLQDEGAA